MSRRAFLCSIGLLAACAPGGSAPDLILYGGKIFTADTATRFVEALAITGDRIVAIGSSDSVRRLAGRSTRLLDLEGRTVVPGFNDAHDHISPELPAARFATSADPTADPPWAQVADSIRAVAARVPPGTWIETQIADRVLGDPAARRAALDRLAPRYPVRLQAWTGHGMILNGAALAAIGVTDDVADPVGGWFERDRSGRLTGLVAEYAEFGLWRRMNQMPDSILAAAFTTRAAEAVRLGITSIQNMATALDAETTGRIVARLDLPVRLRIIRFPGSTTSGLAIAAWRGLTSAPGARIRVSGTKWVLDGTPIERLAALRAPYSDRPGWRGRLDFPPDTVRAILAEILAAGDQPILHAVGDSTIGLVLSTMSALAPDSVWRALRPRIEHGDGLAPDQYAAVRRLGVVITQNPTHLALGAVAPTRYGPDRLAVFQPMRSLLANGIPLALGSDGPNNPFLNLMLAAVHPDHPAEAISVEDAVRAYTAGSAYAERAEADKGRLAPGLLADLAVLSQDIFAIPPSRLPATTSLLTLVGGRPVWDPDGRMR